MDPELVSVSLLQSIPLFNDVPREHLDGMARISHLLMMKEGSEIFHEGDARDFLYIVLEGRVALEIHIPNRGRLRILTVEPLEVLGWSSIADAARRRTATARAVAPGKLLAINADGLQKACAEDPKLGFVIMNHVANVIASRLIATRMQLLDMFANPPSEGSHG